VAQAPGPAKAEKKLVTPMTQVLQKTVVNFIPQLQQENCSDTDIAATSKMCSDDDKAVSAKKNIFDTCSYTVG
jgi:hypothetical protein